MQDDGDGQGDVEAAGPERKPGAVGPAERDAAPLGEAAQRPRDLQDRQARVDADDRPAPADEPRDVAQHHARAAADLEHARALPDRDEAQEAPAQTRLGRRAPALLEGGREPRRVGLGVDVTPRIGGQRLAGQEASGAARAARALVAAEVRHVIAGRAPHRA